MKKKESIKWKELLQNEKFIHIVYVIPCITIILTYYLHFTEQLENISSIITICISAMVFLTSLLTKKRDLEKSNNQFKLSIIIFIVGIILIFFENM